MIRPGQPIRANDINGIPAQTKNGIMAGSGMLRQQMGASMIMEPAYVRKNNIFFAAVIEVYDGNWLGCAPIDVTLDYDVAFPESVLFYVRKPFNLAMDTWNEKTQTLLDYYGPQIWTYYTGEGYSLDEKYMRYAVLEPQDPEDPPTGVAEVQQITPSFYYGEHILVGEVNSYINPENRLLPGYYHDLNQAGRSWARSLNQSL